MRNRLATAAATAIAALLLLTAGCHALTEDEAGQAYYKAFWQLYGPSLPDCNGDLLTSMLFAQASSACNSKMTEISDGQVANICSSTCQTSECQDVSNCLLAAVPVSIVDCAQECLTADDAIGVNCAKAIYMRQAQDFSSWALALTTGQQLPAEADNFLRTITDAYAQVGAGRRRLLAGAWDSASLSQKIDYLFSSASHAAAFMAACTQRSA